MSRPVGSSGLRPPVPEGRKAANAAARSAGQARRQEGLRDDALRIMFDLELEGCRRIAAGGPLPLTTLQALALRGHVEVEQVWTLTPAGRKRAACLLAGPERRA